MDFSKIHILLWFWSQLVYVLTGMETNWKPLDNKTNHIIKKIINITEYFTIDRKYLLCAVCLSLNKTIYQDIQANENSGELLQCIFYLLWPQHSHSWLYRCLLNHGKQQPHVSEDFQSDFPSITFTSVLITDMS